MDEIPDRYKTILQSYGPSENPGLGSKPGFTPTYSFREESSISSDYRSFSIDYLISTREMPEYVDNNSFLAKYEISTGYSEF